MAKKKKKLPAKVAKMGKSGKYGAPPGGGKAPLGSGKAPPFTKKT